MKDVIEHALNSKEEWTDGSLLCWFLARARLHGNIGKSLLGNHIAIMECWINLEKNVVYFSSICVHHRRSL